jgi:dTDP-4-amino-4,6-dideoxygalactose transaminase
LDRLRINRAEFIAALSASGIGTSVHYLPLHMHPYYREKFGYSPTDLPCMARVYPEIISLPLYPAMSEADVDFVCRTITDLVVRNRQSTFHFIPEVPAPEQTGDHVLALSDQSPKAA